MSTVLHKIETLTKPGDLVQQVTERDKSFIFKLSPGDVFQTHFGEIQHDNLIGMIWGYRVKSYLGKVFVLLKPALDDLIRAIPRKTQIMYPKDIGYILVTNGIGPFTKVNEAGSGSGGLTTALAFSVGDAGLVISYENNEKYIRIAENNLKTFGLKNRVIFKLRDISNGFDEKNAQALFLDLQNPDNYISQARAALIPGGYFGCILPTTNQVSLLITALKKTEL